MVTPFAQGAVLRAMGEARHVSIAELTSREGVMILTPHPDDETLGCGGAMSAAIEAGQDVTVVVLTDGSGSHPNSKQYPARRLANLREDELKIAVSRMTSGKARIDFLRYKDQNVPETAHDRRPIIAQLSTIIQSHRIGTVWTTWRGDPHPDHKAANDIAKILVGLYPYLNLWAFPIWGRFIDVASAGSNGWVQFDTIKYRDEKAAAISAYRSQMTQLITDDPDGFVMEKEMQSHFLESPEFFLRETGDEPSSETI